MTRLELLQKIDSALDSWHAIPLAKRALIVATTFGSFGYTLTPEDLARDPKFLFVSGLVYVVGGLLDEAIKALRSSD